MAAQRFKLVGERVIAVLKDGEPRRATVVAVGHYVVLYNRELRRRERVYRPTLHWDDPVVFLGTTATRNRVAEKHLTNELDWEHEQWLNRQPGY